MDFQAVPEKIAQPTADQLRALTSQERQCWTLIDSHSSIERIAYKLSIPNHQDDVMVKILSKFIENGWIR